MKMLRAWVVLGLAVSILVGCEANSKSEMKSETKGSEMKSMSASGTMAPSGMKTLYERLGGEPAVTAVVEDFVGRAAADPKVNFTRKGTPYEWQATDANVAKLK